MFFLLSIFSGRNPIIFPKQFCEIRYVFLSAALCDMCNRKRRVFQEFRGVSELALMKASCEAFSGRSFKKGTQVLSGYKMFFSHIGERGIVCVVLFQI